MASSEPVAQIPVLRGQHDMLAAGAPRSLKVEALAPHPVQKIQSVALKNEWEMSQFNLERVYGSTAAWTARMDRAVLSQVRRLPGVPSAFVGLDTMLGRDERMGFEDYLNAPHLRPEMPKLSVHEATERMLRM